MGTDQLTARLEVDDIRTKEELAEIIGSVKGWNLVEPPGPYSLLLLEVGRDPERDFRRISQVQVSGEAEDIFLTSPEVDPNVLIRALHAGVREFFPQPLKREVVVEALLKFGQRKREVKEVVVTKAARGKVFTVFGAKGGVGTTTVAVNVATGMARPNGKPSVALLDMNLLAAGMARPNGKPSVALLDMNLFSGDVPLFLNIKPVFSWTEVARNVSRLDATYLMGILQRHESGVHILPTPVRVAEEVDTVPEVIDKVIKLMRSVFDFIVIDGGRPVGSILKYLAVTADKVVLVTIPTLPGIINLKRLIEIFHDLGQKSEDIIVVLNRYNQKAGVSSVEIRNMIKEDIRWYLPNDYRNTMTAINSGEPLTSTVPNADVTRRILELARSLSGGEDGMNRQVTDRRRRFLGIF